METIPEFEYDPAKSHANLAKHGIDFETAQQVWRDGRGIEIVSQDTAERRLLRVGMIGPKHWTAVFTWREKRVRIISARRARLSESKAYDAENDQR